MWIQIRGLPNHWSSKEVGWKLGKLFNHCLNVILLEHGSREGKLLNLFVEINLDKPLMRGSKIKIKNEEVWVEFKYENLPVFCFYCGVVGHQERAWVVKLTDSREGKVCEGQYGEWMRAVLHRGGRKGNNGESVSPIQQVGRERVRQVEVGKEKTRDRKNGEKKNDKMSEREGSEREFQRGIKKEKTDKLGRVNIGGKRV